MDFSVWFVVIFPLTALKAVSAATCKKLDECSCELSDGKGIVSLWEVDGGRSGPSYTEIPDYDISSTFKFSWNPCTSFSNSGDCKDVKICQRDTNTGHSFTLARSVSSFSYDGSDVTINYNTVSDTGYARTTSIALHCDSSGSKKGDLPNFKETKGYQESTYKATLTSKCACPGACSWDDLNPSGSLGGLSVGSVLLIIFLPSLLIYFVGGILVNRYYRNVESMPEMIPNLSFWKDLPFLVKDGFVFTFSKVKCGKTTYEQM